MRTAAAISAALHILVFAIAWIGVLPSSKPFIAPATAIEVEIATAFEKPKPEPVAKPQPKRKPPPPPPPRREPPPPPEPQVAAKPPEPEAVPAPPPPKAVVKPKPKPKAQKPEKKKPQKAARKPLPRPKAKPKPPPPKAKASPPPKPEPKPKPKHDFASVLKTVSKLEKKPPPPERKAEKNPSAMQQVAAALERTRPKVQQALRATDGLTESELNAIQEHIEPCWSLPAGARDAQTMIVEIRATLNPDGRVRSAFIVDTARARNDGFYRSMAESALRAMLNPRCQPLPLPLNKYSEWRDMVIFFDPRKMF